jgi:hypothetical protein
MALLGWKRTMVAACTLAVVAAACGGDVADVGYTASNRRAFLAACTESLQDSTLVRDVCECTYDEIRSSVPYNDLVKLEESLALDSLAPMPDYVVAIIADCFVLEAEL